MNDLTCFAPTGSIRHDGPSTVEFIPFASFNWGGLSTNGIDFSNTYLWILVNHLISAAPVELTYSFQLAQPPPFFFQSDPYLANRKTNQDAHTIAVDKNWKVLFSVPPGEEIVITPPGLLALAGWEWNLQVLLKGGEFSAAVNCYNDGMDLPSLDWTDHSAVIPSSQIPLCLVSVDALRDSSVAKFTDLAAGNSMVTAHIRFDTRTGDSFFRCPSLAGLILSLIQGIILLSVPTALSTFFATSCLGSLSQIFKRAQVECFFIGFQMPSLGLRLVSDSMALATLSTEASIDTATMQKELQKMFSALVNPPNSVELADDISAHIFRQDRKIQDLSKKSQEETSFGVDCKPVDLADLLSVGQRARARDVAAYFERDRRRGCLEWSVLPNSHRAELRTLRRSKAQPTESGPKKPAFLARLSSRISTLQPVEVKVDFEEEENPPTEKEMLQFATEEATSQLENLKEELRFMSQLNSKKTKDKDNERERRREGRHSDIRQLLQALEHAKARLNARVTSAKAHDKELLRALKKNEHLEQRLDTAVQKRAKLILELQGFRNRILGVFHPPPECSSDEYGGHCLVAL
eukprot:Skav220151  [mRNA]  locus=scaffold564:14955:16688:+ [translate_table: standard]